MKFIFSKVSYSTLLLTDIKFQFLMSGIGGVGSYLEVGGEQGKSFTFSLAPSVPTPYTMPIYIHVTVE